MPDLKQGEILGLLGQFHAAKHVTVRALMRLPLKTHITITGTAMSSVMTCWLWMTRSVRVRGHIVSVIHQEAKPRS